MTYLSTILADSPTLVWALDETTGTVATDQSGNANHGTYHGTPTLAGRNLWPSNDCVELAAGDYVEIDTPISLSSTYSIEAWCIREPSTITGTFYSVVFGDGNLSGGQVVYLAAQVSSTFDPDDNFYANRGFASATIIGTVQAYGSGSTDVMNTSMSTYGLHHLVMTVDDTSRDVLIYVDGEYWGGSDISPQSFNSFGTFTPRVGFDGVSSGDFVGGVGWVAVYDGVALSAAQVLAHYQASGFRSGYDSGALGTEYAGLYADFGVTDSATLTDSELRTVFLYDTDTGTLTDAEQRLVNLYTTDSSLFSDISRFVNPYPEAVDVAYLAERATLLPANPADWPFDGPYDFAITSRNSDFANAEVIYSTDAAVYDFAITSPVASDFITDQ